MAEKPATLAELRQKFDEQQAAQDALKRKVASLDGMSRKGGKQAGDAERARLRLLRRNEK